MTLDSTNPGLIYTNSTWIAWGSGQVPVGVNANDTDFNTVEKTGGAKSHSYTPAGSTASVTLTAEQSGVPAHSHGLNNHTHSIDHGHGFTQPSVTGGSHNHIAKVGQWGAGAASNTAGLVQNYGTGFGVDMTTSNTSHTHTVSGGAVSNMSGSSGAATGSTADNTAKNATKGHSHSFTGTAASISHLQPYITCYMWKRTA